MALLKDLGSLFRRKKPVAIDVSGTQAEGLDNQSRDGVKKSSANKSHGDPLAGDTNERSIERKPGRSRNDAPSYNEAVDMIRRVGDHLDGQAQRTDRMLELIERLPNAIDALPEINRQNARLLEVISDHLEHARSRDNTLHSTLDGLADASGRQTEVLGLIQQQLDRNNQTSDAMAENFSSFRQALDEMASSHNRSVTAITELAQSYHSREEDMMKRLSRTQTTMMVVAICCVVASVAAVIAAGVALGAAG